MNNNTDTPRRILVIDDNESIHQDFRKILASAPKNDGLAELDAELFSDEMPKDGTPLSFDLCFAAQGKEGYEQLKQQTAEGRPFDAAFVDMRMPPGWDGVETIEHLWQADPDLQVVICTAYSDHSWEEIVARLGRTDRLVVLKKPFDQIEVVQLAISLSEKRRLLSIARQRMHSLEQDVEATRVELDAAHQDAEILLESISSAIVSLDQSGVVARWNPVAADLFNISAEKAVGTKFNELPLQWVDVPDIHERILDCGGNGATTTDLKFKDGDGTARLLSARITPILNDESGKSRLIVATDVTMQRQMASQLDQAHRMESVGQLAAGVAHEINTPMQYIGDNVRFVAKSLQKLDPLLDCLKLIVDPEVTDDQIHEVRQELADSFTPKKIKNSLQQLPEALNDSIDGVESVSKIVSAMKEFSHPGTDQKSQVCINHILESTITVAKNEWKYVADIETELDPDLQKVDALSGDLNQAFLNIIVNASHAIGDRVQADEISKGLIRIKTTEVDDSVVISIEDNGGGIPSHVQSKVFEPFFTTKEVGKGTGQGLAIAFNVITKKHDGAISFDVEEGVGTTFHIRLPRTATETPETQNDLVGTSEGER